MVEIMASDRYNCQIEQIVEILTNPRLENDDLKKSLELIIDLRIDMIETCNEIEGDGLLERYSFQMDQIDKLYKNRCERKRLQYRLG